MCIRDSPGPVDQRVAERTGAPRHHPPVRHLDPLGQHQLQQQRPAQPEIDPGTVDDPAPELVVREERELFEEVHTPTVKVLVTTTVGTGRSESGRMRAEVKRSWTACS